MEALIQTHQLSIGYPQRGQKTHPLHRHLNLRLNAGEFCCLLGPNGAGKSTLLRTFSGFLKPLGGSIILNGHKLEEINEKDLSQRISMVLTERPALGHMTVFELVAMGRYPYTGFFGRLTGKDKTIIRDAIEEVGLTSLQNRSAGTLSDGELQKAMIAKALAQQTPLILLDEPTAFLDLPSRINVMELLHQLALKHNKGILLSTHHLELALRFADKIWLLAPNKPMVCGVPEDLVLQHHIADFFEKDGVRFDIHSGSFLIANGAQRKIKITGQGIAMEWVERALLRHGFVAQNQDEGLAQIQIQETAGQTQFILCVDGQSEVLTSVEALMESLKPLQA